MWGTGAPGSSCLAAANVHVVAAAAPSGSRRVTVIVAFEVGKVGGSPGQPGNGRVGSVVGKVGVSPGQPGNGRAGSVDGSA